MVWIKKKKCKYKLNTAENDLGSVWYVCLKTENYYLKIFMEICVGKKMY